MSPPLGEPVACCRLPLASPPPSPSASPAAPATVSPPSRSGGGEGSSTCRRCLHSARPPPPPTVSSAGASSPRLDRRRPSASAPPCPLREPAAESVGGEEEIREIDSGREPVGGGEEIRWGHSIERDKKMPTRLACLHPAWLGYNRCRFSKETDTFNKLKVLGFIKNRHL